MLLAAGWLLGGMAVGGFFFTLNLRNPLLESAVGPPVRTLAEVVSAALFRAAMSQPGERMPRTNAQGWVTTTRRSKRRCARGYELVEHLASGVRHSATHAGYSTHGRDFPAQQAPHCALRQGACVIPERQGFFPSP